MSDLVKPGHGDHWLAALGLPGRVARCHLPWDRTFEIGLELCE